MSRRGSGLPYFFVGAGIGLIPSVIDISAMFFHLPAEHGLRWLLHNPGSILFHLVILPAILALLFEGLFRSPAPPTTPRPGWIVRQWLRLSRSVRNSLTQPDWPVWLRLIWVPAMLIFLFALLGAFSAGIIVDTEDMVGRRLIEPCDLADPDKRKEALTKELELRKTPAESELDRVAAYKLFLESPEMYGRAVTWGDLGFMATMGRILSTFGIWSGCFVYWLILVFVPDFVRLKRRRDHNQAKGSIDESLERWLQRAGVMTTLLIAWLPMRAYSEWYAEFEVPNLAQYEAFVGKAVLLSILLFVLLFCMWDARKVAVWAFLGASGLALIGYLKPDVVQTIARAIDNLGVVALLSIYFGAALAVAVLVLAFVVHIDEAPAGGANESESPPEPGAET